MMPIESPIQIRYEVVAQGKVIHSTVSWEWASKMWRKYVKELGEVEIRAVRE